MYRYSIIACARWETPYIGEWIAYHKAVGFQRIYLCCNDDDPAEMKAAVAAAITDCKDLVSFTHFPEQGRQSEMYLDALVQARRETEWVMFLDIDEFIVLRDCNDIDRFMKPFAHSADSVYFNWLNFGNSGFVERPPGSVLRQYTRRSARVSALTKHLSRTALLAPDRLRQGPYPFWHGLADPVWSSLKRVNVLGVDIGSQLSTDSKVADSYLADSATREAMLSKAVCNHYGLKSEADFLLRAARGTGGEFSGQVIWKQAYESGNFRAVLRERNMVEDTYLCDLSLREFGTQPAQPLRTVHARHRHWTGDLILGSNGRLLHPDRGTLAEYRTHDNTLHVQWDKWPEDQFVNVDDVFHDAKVDDSSKPRCLQHRAPLFLLTVQRSGGTILARVLNCHPEIVIWGEHIGFINKLAEMDDIIRKAGPLMKPKTDEQIEDHVAFSNDRLPRFDPWVNAFDYESFCNACREIISSQFTRGLKPNQRWGFKEIRYHRLLTAQFLDKLFPDCRFVILRRDPTEVATSAILASFSLFHLKEYREAMPLAVADAIVRDVTYAILAIERGLDEIHCWFGSRSLKLDYDQLQDPRLSVVPSLFDFCRLDLSENVLTRVRRVLEVRAGSSDRSSAFGGILSSDFIRERATALVPSLREEIASQGIDRRRLCAREGLGAFSFLIGDHMVRSGGGSVSSLF